VILHLHPSSKLLFKYPVLDRPMARQRLQNWFGEDGISAERLLFEGNTDDLEHLASWNRVDIAFDPYPYNGCISTLDALWMGVPVVSMHGRLAVSCCGLSLLAPLGMPVAKSFEEYIALASELVKTVAATPDIKQRVRQALRRSELMDEAGLIRALESAYRDMWRSWCLSAR
jgi:predicted O-linked N-acetylglucosamine transferase (SPINDLY family)